MVSVMLRGSILKNLKKLITYLGKLDPYTKSIQGRIN